MADGHHNTQNPSGADLSNRTLNGLDLEIFITPLVNATRVLSLLNPDDMQGVGAVEAYQWLACFAHDRAHELQSFCDGHLPEYHTGMEADDRAKAFKGLPPYSEWMVVAAEK